MRRQEIDRMISPIRVVAAVIAREDRLLVCQRPLHKRHGGLWEFPGGKSEAGESDEAAVRRELLEELAVEAVAVGGELAIFADEGSEFAIAFLPVEIAGEPKALEHNAIRWATPSELLQMPLAPSDRRFVQQVIEAQ